MVRFKGNVASKTLTMKATASDFCFLNIVAEYACIFEFQNFFRNSQKLHSSDKCIAQKMCQCCQTNED